MFPFLGIKQKIYSQIARSPVFRFGFQQEQQSKLRKKQNRK